MCDKPTGLPSTAKKARSLGLSVYFTGKPCPKGHVMPRRLINRGCTQCHTESQAQPHRGASRSNWLKNNKSKAQEASRAWKSRNAARVLAINASRRAMGRVFLSEFDQFVIDELYDQARKLSRITGKPWHVDHIVPLKHKAVCGLHVPANLRAIPAAMNIAKKNRFNLGGV